MSDLFSAILMDPPWPEHGGGKIKRGADRHYPLVPCSDMRAVIELSGVWRPAADAHLYCWVTDTYLREGLRLVADLGFRYVRTLAWFKSRVTEEQLEQDDLQTGLGQYFRGAHELCLFAVRGEGYAVRTERRDLKSAIVAERTRHSSKPASFHDLIEARSRGPYLEMFSRAERSGWTSWGNERPRPEASGVGAGMRP